MLFSISLATNRVAKVQDVIGKISSFKKYEEVIDCTRIGLIIFTPEALLTLNYASSLPKLSEASVLEIFTALEQISADMG